MMQLRFHPSFSLSFCHSSLMLEGDDLLDGHLVAGHRVGGGGHHAVRTLTQELKVVVPGANLQKMSVFVSLMCLKT